MSSTSTEHATVTIHTEHDADRLARLGALFDEYVQWNVEHIGASPYDAQPHARSERDDLARRFAPPGVLLAALAGEELAGMAGVTIVDSATAEISRCFVRADHRGRSIGRALVARAVDHARASGASRVVLDTFPERMAPAVRLYQSLGFAMAQVSRLPGIEPALTRMVLPLD